MAQSWRNVSRTGSKPSSRLSREYHHLEANQERTPTTRYAITISARECHTGGSDTFAVSQRGLAAGTAGYVGGSLGRRVAGAFRRPEAAAAAPLREEPATIPQALLGTDVEVPANAHGRLPSRTMRHRLASRLGECTFRAVSGPSYPPPMRTPRRAPVRRQAGPRPTRDSASSGDMAELEARSLGNAISSTYAAAYAR